MEANRLIAAQSRGPVDVTVGRAPVVEIALGSDDEERQALGERIQAVEVDVAPIHDIERARLQCQLVEDRDVVHLSVGDVDKAGDVATQVQQRMQLDGSFALAKARPGKERETQIDGGRIERVGRLCQGHAEVVASIQLPGNVDEHLGEVGVDAPVSRFVGIGQCAAGDVPAKPNMVEFGSHDPQAGFDVAKTLPIGQLRERHAEELIAARETPDSVVASIAPHAGIEFAFREEVQQL